MAKQNSAAKPGVKKRQAGESLDYALDGAGIGTWDLILGANNTVTWDDTCRALFGLAEGNLMPYEKALAYIHPEDREKVQKAIARAIHPKNGGKFNVKYRTIGGDDGILRLLEFRGKAYFDENNVAYRFAGIAMDISSELSGKAAELESQKALLSDVENMFKHVTRSSPTGLWLSDQDGNLTYLNDTLVGWTGMSYSTLLGTGWANAVIDEDREKAATAFMAAINARAHYDVEFRIKKGDGTIMWCRAAGDPFYEKDGSYGGYSGFCMDIDERVANVNIIKEAEASLRVAIDVAELGTWDLDPVTGAFKANARLKEWFGLPFDAEVPLTLALDVIHENDRERVAAAIQQSLSYASGGHYDTEYTIITPVTGQQRIVRAQGKASFTNEQVAYRLNGTLQDITTQVNYLNKIEESELFVRNVFYNSPVAKIVYIGDTMIIRDVNESMLKIFGRESAEGFVGLPLLEAVPEFAQTPLFSRYQKVLTTGEIHVESAELIKLVKYGETYLGYYDYIYKPLRNTSGDIYGVICTAVDVTGQVIARRKLEETESRLRSAIELAGLANWNLNIKENTFSYSNRFMDWLGFSEDTKGLDEAYNPLPEEYRLSVPNAIAEAIKPGSKGFYDNIHPIINRVTGQTRIIHAQGQVFYDAAGEPEMLRGTAQDITIQQELKMALSHEVQQRTEELAAVIEELQVTNEELAQSNDNLIRSNEELSQYAYVASHDLQEPLRKILVFSDLLEQHSGLSGTNLETLIKIGRSSKRMSLLINDLLEFSRLLNSDKMTRPVNLSETVNEMITDFELIIKEKNARITIHPGLPTIEAIALQMNQLFYNLISNALKFTKEGTVPVIDITTKELTPQELQKHMPRHDKKSRYYDITIRDNGIGFDTKFSEQIFEVFKRLHGREVFSGSGIGLALCRRIVTNHGGVLYAESEPGKGAAFHILLAKNMRASGNEKV